MDDKIIQLIDIIANSVDVEEKIRAIEAIQWFKDKRAVVPLIDALRDPDPRIRQWAASGLGRLKDTQAVEALVITLQDTTNYVCSCAAVALGEIGDERATIPLIAMVEYNKDPYFRGAVIVALEKIYRQLPLQAQLLFLGSSHAVVREYALRKLADLPIKSSFDSIINMHILHLFVYTLKDPSRSVRGMAYVIMARLIGQKTTFTTLLSLLKETEDNKESWAAIVLLGEIGDIRAVNDLHRVTQEQQRKIQRGKRPIYLKTAALQAIKRIEGVQ